MIPHMQISCEAYRKVVRGDERFVDYFGAATPVSELGRMNIGSRPAKRKNKPTIDTLRAIPWIFAWTQTRFNLPVWLGMGEAFLVRPPPRPADLLLAAQLLLAGFGAFVWCTAYQACACQPRVLHHLLTACLAD